MARSLRIDVAPGWYLCSTEESNAGGFQYPAVNAAIGRFERRLKIDRDLQKKLKKIAK
jgi:hypothetical protein